MTVLAAAPAFAGTTTIALTGSNATIAAGTPVTKTASGLTVTAKGYSFAATPTAFQTAVVGANISTLFGSPLVSNQRLHLDTSGIGVCAPGDAANQCNQIDTDGTNEFLRLILPERYELTSATFSRVDNNDTLKIYGVDASGLVHYLGFGGRFDGVGSGVSGHTAFTGITGVQTGGSGEDQLYNVMLNTAAYKEFWFTNQNDSADGYRLGTITLTAVPEPATWAMLIAGFGLTGAALRGRRQHVVIAA